MLTKFFFAILTLIIILVLVCLTKDISTLAITIATITNAILLYIYLNKIHKTSKEEDQVSSKYISAINTNDPEPIIEPINTPMIETLQIIPDEPLLFNDIESKRMHDEKQRMQREEQSITGRVTKNVDYYKSILDTEDLNDQHVWWGNYDQ